MIPTNTQQPQGIVDGVQPVEQNNAPDEPLTQESAVPEEWKNTLKTLLHRCELEDNDVHQIQVRKARRLTLYFNNLVTIFWDDEARDFRVPDWDALEDEGVPPRIINIYRPHAESIIAALSVSIPNSVWSPKDPDNPLDIDAAKSKNNLSKIVQKDNDAKLLFIKALSIYFNQGTIFGYTYCKRDKAFGYFHSLVKDNVNIEENQHSCSLCGYEYGPGGEQPEVGVKCPECGQIADTDVEKVTKQVEVPRIDTKEKSKAFIDLFGVVNVKIPYSVRTQSHIGYLICKFDQNVALLREVYCKDGANGEAPLAEWIEASHQDTAQDSWTRFPTIYQGSQPQNTAVVKLAWFRPWQLNLVAKKDDRDIIDEIQGQFPEGVFVTFINDVAVEVYGENLDDHWTISIDPRADGLHAEPLGTNLATVQDIQAEANELELQTMEHGISQNFVASDFLDWDKYRKTQARPGDLIPVNKEPGKAIGDSIFETKTATLSPEMEKIDAKYKNLAEFVVGDFPNIYGGPSGNSDETATAYVKSQAAAKQRLGTTWFIASTFWSDLVGKATEELSAQLEWEEKLTTQAPNGQFSSQSVNPEGLIGETGKAECDSSDQLPISWEQVRDLVNSLFTMNNEGINSVLQHPENFQLMKKVYGQVNAYIPGENDRDLQYREIQLMLQGMFVEPEPFNNDDIHAEICQVWLSSSDGQKTKYENPMAYEMIVGHWQMHEDRKQQMLMAQAAQAAAMNPKSNKSQSGESNAS